jgi:hypothetical protein
MRQLVQLKSGLSIDRLEGEGGKWSPLSIKMDGRVVGWLTTFEGVPTLIVSPRATPRMTKLPDSGYSALKLERNQ